VECEVFGGISDREIVARQLGLGHIKGHLITSQPAQITANSCAIDGWSTVEVNISVQSGCVVLVFGFDDSSFFAVVW